MTNMIRRDPFTDLRSTMDRLFDEGFSRPWRFINSETYEASMPIEVSETDSELVVKAALPGVQPDEVDITVSNDGFGRISNIATPVTAVTLRQTSDAASTAYPGESKNGAGRESRGKLSAAASVRAWVPSQP